MFAFNFDFNFVFLYFLEKFELEDLDQDLSEYEETPTRSHVSFTGEDTDKSSGISSYAFNDNSTQNDTLFNKSEHILRYSSMACIRNEYNENEEKTLSKSCTNFGEFEREQQRLEEDLPEVHHHTAEVSPIKFRKDTLTGADSNYDMSISSLLSREDLLSVVEMPNECYPSFVEPPLPSHNISHKDYLYLTPIPDDMEDV